MLREKKKKGPTDEALIAEGLAAYESKQARASNPYGDIDNVSLQGERHHRAFLWRYGWGTGHVRDTEGKGIPEYSSVPGDCVPEITHTKEFRELLNRRDEAPPLPWTMDSLVGSTWVNLWSGARHTVVAIVCERSGLPIPCWSQDGEGVYAYLHGPGIWWSNRYVIDNWLRLDTLQLALQEIWNAKTAAYEFEQIQSRAVFGKPHSKFHSQPQRETPVQKQPDDSSQEQLSLF